jgi:ribonuclease III
MRSTTWSAGWADPLNTDALRRFAERLGCPFNELELLELALTHRSWCAENGGRESNERLEFLGDAVLGVVVTAHLFREFPSMPEGELAKVRAAVVSAATMAELAVEVELGEVLLLGKGEDGSGGRSKPSILADAMEAVIGATYLDLGADATERLVLGLLVDRIDEAAEGPGGHDYKTQLQELAARDFEQLPEYELRDEGPDHAKRFYAVVRLGGEPKGHGEGRSKKQAEQDAARRAWRDLTSPGTESGPAASGPATVGAAAGPRRQGSERDA